MSKLAVEYGLTWDQIWDDSANKKLKKLRKNPNVLMPGDIVKIPKKKEKKKNKGTGQKHDFKRNKEQSKVKLRLLFDDEPIQNQPCRLEIGDASPRMGNVNGNGDVAIEGQTEFVILSSITFAKLFVGEAPHETLYQLHLGHLNPHDDITGVQQRLNNLGYKCGAVDGVHGPKTTAAIRQFQETEEISVDGLVTNNLTEKLLNVYGC